MKRSRARACPAYATLLLVALCALAANAQDKKTDKEEMGAGVIFGRDIMFVVKAPEGWVLDGESGAQQGVSAVFYPKGSSWKDGAAVMYVNTACRCGAKSLEEFTEGDVQGFKEDSPGLKVSDAPPPKLAGGEKALAKRFSGDRNGNVESVAYVEEGEDILIFVLTARTQKDYDVFAKAFDELVSSYKFVAKVVKQH